MQNWQKALEKANSLRRCGARTRAGNSCLSPAMPNSRCRMHGGKSPGAPKGKLHGKYKHGVYTLEFKKVRKYISTLNLQTKKMLKDNFLVR